MAMSKVEYNRQRYEQLKPIYDEFMKVYPFGLEDLPGEMWRPIPNYENYQCSNFGRVKSFWNNKVKIMKPSLGGTGYLTVKFRKDGEPKYFLIHRLVAELFIENPGNKPQVNHIDGCKFNNFVGNLEWATQSENNQHAHDTGLAPSGEDHSNAKLTNEQALYIRENPDDLTGELLAEKFAVTPRTISAIQLGKKYKNADGKIRQAPNRLSEKQKEEICNLRATGEYTRWQLSKMFGVSHGMIDKIIREGK